MGAVAGLSAPRARSICRGALLALMVFLAELRPLAWMLLLARGRVAPGLRLVCLCRKARPRLGVQGGKPLRV